MTIQSLIVFLLALTYVLAEPLPDEVIYKDIEEIAGKSD